MASERDIVERLRANADKYPGFENLNTEAAATIETLRAEVRAWRSGYETWDRNPNPRAFMHRPHSQCDATDSTGALGKEGRHGQV